MPRYLQYRENGLTFLCDEGNHLTVWRGAPPRELLDTRKWRPGLKPTNEAQLEEAVHNLRETTEPHPWETPFVADIEGVIVAPQGAASADLQAVLDHLVEVITGARVIPLEDVMRVTFSTTAYLEVHKHTGEVLVTRVLTPMDATWLSTDDENEEDLERIRHLVGQQTWPAPEWES